MRITLNVVLPGTHTVYDAPIKSVLFECNKRDTMKAGLAISGEMRTPIFMALTQGDECYVPFI